MSGLELKAHKGRLVHVRRTGRVDDMFQDEDDDVFWCWCSECEPVPGWFMLVMGLVLAAVFGYLCFGPC